MLLRDAKQLLFVPIQKSQLGTVQSYYPAVMLEIFSRQTYFILPFNFFYNSNQLLKDVSLFLQSWMRTQPFAKECILRLQKTMRVGQRKYPPHPVEVNAIQVIHNTIFTKVPNIAISSHFLNCVLHFV